MRAAQSKGKIDLLALWPVQLCNGDGCYVGCQECGAPAEPPWLVQCKTGTARMSKQDKHDLVSLALKTGAVAVLAEPGKNGRGVLFTNLHTDKEITL